MNFLLSTTAHSFLAFVVQSLQSAETAILFRCQTILYQFHMPYCVLYVCTKLLLLWGMSAGRLLDLHSLFVLPLVLHKVQDS